MRNSSRFLYGIGLLALFMGVAFAIDLLTTSFILRGQVLDASRVGRVINHADVKEFPIFGASKVVADYRPDVLGLPFYNYGLVSASPAVTNYLLTFELQKHSDGPIFIDFFQGNLTDIGDPRNYLPFTNIERTQELLAQAGKWRWYYAIPGLRYFGTYDWYLRGTLSDYVKGTRVVSRGYTRELIPTQWDKARFNEYVQLRSKLKFRWQVNEAQAKEFLELIRSAPNRMFVIVLSPLHQSFLAGSTGEAEFRERMLAFERLPNVRLIDFSRVDYPDNYFTDTGHLNFTGAGVFSTQLRDRLREIGVVPAG